MSLSSITEDIQLLEYFESFESMTLVYDIQLIYLLTKYKEFLPKRFLQLTRCMSFQPESINSDVKEGLSIFEFIIPILEFGKVCICGPCVVETMIDTVLESQYIDFYFHSCSIEEVSVLFGKCLKVLERYLHERTTTESFLDRIFYCKMNNMIIIDLPLVDVRFSCNVFNNRQDILTSMGNSILKHGYDLQVGYFSTIPAAISLCTNTAYVPINFDNMKFYHRWNIIPLYNGATASLSNNTLNKESSLNIYNFNGNKIRCIDVELDSEERSILHVSNLVKVKFSIYSSIITNRVTYNFKEDYKSKIVGIHNDRYVALANCITHFHINKDLFRVICYYWLKIEVLDAQMRLLG